jgi:hypothetical protein
MDKILTQEGQAAPAPIVKRRHHYVWKKYLKAWSTDDLIWCRQGRKIFNPNLDNVAVCKDFYTLKELSAADIEILYKLAIEPSSSHLQKLNKGWISLLNSPFDFKRELEQRGINNSTELNASFNKAIQNVQEDIHGKIEDIGAEYLASALNEDVNFFKDEIARVRFIYFLCIQYLRTNKMKSSVLDRIHRTPHIDMGKIWDVLILIFATNLGWSFYEERASFRIVLLKNQSRKEFITGDQPVINICDIKLEKTGIPDDIEFYYPISPKLAILVTKNFPSNLSEQIALEEGDVTKYNLMMIAESHSQIYAASEKTLMAYEND